MDLIDIVLARGGDSGGGGSTGGGVLSIGLTMDAQAGAITMDKTWQEIYDHITGGGFAFAYSSEQAWTLPVSQVGDGGGGVYFVYAYLVADDDPPVIMQIFATESPDDYPTMTIGG